MKWLRKESARYALLLVLLLATATVAVLVTLSFMDDIVPHKGNLTVVTTAIWALTMGFMLIAGAFGLWAIHFAAETESLRRLGSLVDAMDYIRDGVVAIDRQGRITGMNPAAVAIFGDSARHTPLTSACPLFPGSDLQAILQSEVPLEREAEIADGGRMRTLRLRSQPSQGIVILLMSDVTDLVRNRERAKRTAFVQLIGHMAKGVANDFNDLLCGISGHAALLARSSIRAINIPASASAIQDCANRGMLLARQLMQLSEPGLGENVASVQTARHIHAGIELLKSSLPNDWTIESAVESDVAPVNIPPVQLEHLVQSLGLVTADAAPSLRHLSVSLAKPDPGIPDALTAAVLTIAAPSQPNASEKLIPLNMEDAGVITSVISSLILQAGGTIEGFSAAGGATVYRVRLPEADAASLAAESPEALALGLEAYAANWHILIDRDMHGSQVCNDYLRHAGIHVRQVQGIVNILSAMEGDDHLDAIVLGSGILGEDRTGLLKAIARLCPRTGIVVQQRDIRDDGIPGIVYVPEHVTPTQLLHAMIEARSRTGKRSRREPAT